MSAAPLGRPKAREAGPELLVLQRWEEFTGWLLENTAKWPKSARFTLTQRVETRALDVMEDLVDARYEPSTRAETLRIVNRVLERMRFLCRIALRRRVMQKNAFETAMRGVDEAGRMIHGWRMAIEERGRGGREAAR